MTSLNQHLPVLHQPTLDLNEMKLPLLLVLSSIGALYCFEGEHARKLHSISAVLLYEVINLNNSSDELETSTIQTIFFVLLFAAWSGDRALFLKHLGLPAILANVFSLRSLLTLCLRRKTKTTSKNPVTSWYNWIEEEQFRRFV